MRLTPRPTRPVTAVRCARSTRLGARFDILTDAFLGGRKNSGYPCFFAPLAIEVEALSLA